MLLLFFNVFCSLLMNRTHMKMNGPSDTVDPQKREKVHVRYIK